MLAAAFVFAIFAIMIGASIMRQLGMRTGGTDDLVAWFCAAARLPRDGAHVPPRRLRARHAAARPARPRRGAARFEIVVARHRRDRSCAYLAWAAVQLRLRELGLQRHGERHDRRSRCGFRSRASCVGTLLLLVAVVEELIVVLAGEQPSYVIAVEERHARGDFSEDI